MQSCCTRAASGGGGGRSALHSSRVNARYSSFAFPPVSSATTAAAGRGFAPASTRRRRASRPAGSKDSGSADGPSTSTTSPRGGASAYRSASSAALPRTISSCAFVSSRQTATWRSGSTEASSSSVAGTRRGDSNATSVPPGSSSTLRSSPFLRGRNPPNRQESAGRPDATSAVIAADGPGSTSTGKPAATHALTST